MAGKRNIKINQHRKPRIGGQPVRILLMLILLLVSSSQLSVAQSSASDGETTETNTDSKTKTTLAPPAGINAADKPWDDGHSIDVFVEQSPDHAVGISYVILMSSEKNGQFSEATKYTVPKGEKLPGDGRISVTIDKLNQGEPYYFKAKIEDIEGNESTTVATATPALPAEDWFAGRQFRLLFVTVILCGSVWLFIEMARRGRPLKVRKIAGLEAVDEAVGRATEMGRSCLYVPGIQDMNDIQTIAGINILSRVAKTAAEFDAKVEVPTTRSLVMTAARETVQNAYLGAGRPDGYNEDLIYYVTDEQFGFVAYMTGMMVREKPAACFYFGAFFAESLILAETGNSIGAIQVAGTAMPSQLPFFVAACDFTLIGEEMFAASAYLSGVPEELGSLKGQDVGKVVVAAAIVIGCFISQFAPDVARWIFIAN